MSKVIEVELKIGMANKLVVNKVTITMGSALDIMLIANEEVIKDVQEIMQGLNSPESERTCRVGPAICPVLPVLEKQGKTRCPAYSKVCPYVGMGVTLGSD